MNKMMQLICVCFVATILVPAIVVQANVISPLCNNKVCKPNEVCRNYKPCALNETCALSAICTTQEDHLQYECAAGSILYHNTNGVLESLTCSDESPCPSEGFCSTALADASSECCLANPVPEDRPGSCPALKRMPDQRCFTDMCKTDADCKHEDEKCCSNGCDMECTMPTPPLPLAPKNEFDAADPCKDTNCPSPLGCRVLKPCGVLEQCDLIAVCAHWKSYACLPNEEPIMAINATGSIVDHICYPGAPCPSNSYCSTHLADASAVCCLKDLDADCTLAPEKGICRALLSRYYYDSSSGTCKLFVYGGCGGNSNNFQTKQECEKKCP